MPSSSLQKLPFLLHLSQSRNNAAGLCQKSLEGQGERACFCGRCSVPKKQVFRLCQNRVKTLSDLVVGVSFRAKSRFPKLW